MNKKYTDITADEIPFDVISFKDVSFKHPESSKYIFRNFNQEVYLKDKIIGITGLSGNGKSSFVKLLVRMNRCTSGTIEIDGKNINDIDPYYIRQNISFVNQNSRLLDRKIMENILYGCKDLDTCNANLREILSYPKIQELYRNVDIEKGDAGPLGEKLSGGQRQVINIINGMIHSSKILILDEPTTGIDPELKQEVLKIIQHFRKNKKCIMIITHDRDVYSLFDETLEL
jgi:ATP-binding cassette subfamily C protein LapB